MIGKTKYPDFIWDTDTGYLTIEKSGRHFIESSEYCDTGPKTFSTIEEIHQYLNENKITGSVGRKLK